MGTTTAIEWTATYLPDGSVIPGKSWNPWQGCTKVSPGCGHCYMFRDKRRYGQDPSTVVRSKDPTFYAPLKWAAPGKVFTCSWSDWFHAAADPWRDEAWAIIRATPHLTYQILTKRPERIKPYLPADWGDGYPNVWLGTSVENQRWTTRIDELLAVPARVRFLSCEPLLGLVDLERWLAYHDSNGEPTFPRRDSGLHWVIVGGESGPDARPMHPDWARSLRDQCQAAGVAFFFKQWGEWAPVPLERETWHDFLDLTGKIGQCRMRADGTWHQDPRGPAPAIIQRVGKKAAGRLLDGREWNQYPTVVGA